MVEVIAEYAHAVGGAFTPLEQVDRVKIAMVDAGLAEHPGRSLRVVDTSPEEVADLAPGNAIALHSLANTYTRHAVDAHTVIAANGPERLPDNPVDRVLRTPRLSFLVDMLGGRGVVQARDDLLTAMDFTSLVARAGWRPWEYELRSHNDTLPPDMREAYKRVGRGSLRDMLLFGGGDIGKTAVHVGKHMLLTTKVVDLSTTAVVGDMADENPDLLVVQVTDTTDHIFPGSHLVEAHPKVPRVLYEGTGHDLISRHPDTVMADAKLALEREAHRREALAS